MVCYLNHTRTPTHDRSECCGMKRIRRPRTYFHAHTCALCMHILYMQLMYLPMHAQPHTHS